jgi:C-terminal processing protease CtpA/Prc
VANDLVKEAADEYMLSAPTPSLAYGGPVALLVNEGSASAAEYMPQFLQHAG